MSPTQTLLDEAVAQILQMNAKLDGYEEKLGSLEEVVSIQTQAIRQLAEARRSDREILNKILEACTRESGTELKDALKHIEAAIGAMAKDVRVIANAVVEPTKPSPTAVA